jgi:uncharacterized protein YdeI (YjbR/CyaY-like superfamily)
MANELPIMFFESEDAWAQWLEDNYATSQGLWLKIAKKGVDQPSVYYPEALNVALCYGWIDGQKGKFDDEYWLQKFTPRRAKSVWSRVNTDKVTELIAQGKMREPGLKEIERAKADGRWDAAYESQSKIVVPEDFQAALDANPEAKEFFEQLNSVNRYAILYRITTAKKPETRQKNIQKFIDMLKAREKLHN